MEKTVSSILILLIWLVYAQLEGRREAYYYDSVMRADRFYSNIHWIYFIQRTLALVIIGICMWSLILPITLAFVFPFIHDGFYYMKRNDLDARIYPQRFKADSSTSTAYFELTYMERVGFFLTGVLLFIGYLFLLNIQLWI